jgi:MFS family permease
MRRVFLLVGAVVLVDTMFFAAVSPLLPHYEQELGLSKTAAGVLTASYPAGTLLGSIPAGWIAMRVGVKPTLLGGLGLLGVSSLAFGFADDVVVLDAARFVQGLGGAAMWAGGLAWLVGVSPPERRGELIGSALGAAIVGVLFGPVIGGAATVIGPEAVFTLVALLAALLAAWAWTLPGCPPDGSAGIGAVFVALRQRPVQAGLWLFTLPAIFAGVLEVLVPLRLDDLGASGVAIGGVFLVASAFEAVLSPLSGRLSDRYGRLAPIRIGLAAAAAMAVLMPLPETVAIAGLALVAAVVTLSIFWAPGMALVSDASEEAGLGQALAFGIANLGWAVGHLVGGGGGAALADATADALPYALLAATCALTLLGVMRLAPRTASARSGA